ncbi:MAG: hypothetical protein ACRDTM_03680, partial [Micromonosporaceae bacterium]
MPAEPTTDSAPRTDGAPSRAVTSPTPSGFGVALTAAGLAIAALVVLLVLGVVGVLPGESLPGLADPGPVTRWGLPLATVLARLAAVVTVGSLLAAAFLSPGLAGERRTAGRTVGPAGYRWLRGASWAA